MDEVKRERPGQAVVDGIMQSFKPVEGRSWYPWEWPQRFEFLQMTKYKSDEFIKRVRRIAESDLFFFCDEILRNQEYPHLCRKLHAEMCHIIEHGNDLVMLIPRNHLKSTLLTEGYVLWRLAKNHNLRILIISETEKPVARAFLAAIKTQIKCNKKLKLIFPDLLPAKEEVMDSRSSGVRESQWNNCELKIKRNMILREPSVTVMGARQQNTGMHYDLIIYDDIMTARNAKTEELREDIKSKYENSLNLLDQNTETRMAGTPYDDNDIYGYLEEQGENAFYVRSYIENGKHIWPVEGNIKRVAKMKKKLSPQLFSAQYFCECIVTGEAAFKPEWIKRLDTAFLRKRLGEEAPQRKDELKKAFYNTLDIYMSMDPSRKPGVHSDFGVILVTGVDEEGFEFDIDIFRERKHGYEMADEFVKMFKKWKPRKSGIEVVGGDNAVYDLVIKKMKELKLPHWSVTGYKATRWDKPEHHIKLLQEGFRNGLMYIEEGPEWEEYENELLRYPHGRHDDIVVTKAYTHTQLIKPKGKKHEVIDIGAWRSRRCGISRRNARRGKLTGTWMSR